MFLAWLGHSRDRRLVFTLLCGLGNPGKEYEGSRHNVGFSFIERTCNKYGAAIFKSSRFCALLADISLEGAKLKLVMPQTFMNNSGKAITKLLNYYDLPLEKVVVVHDDIDLPLGRIKIKLAGGCGGHNGIKSIDNCAGNGYWRIRIGVNRPPSGFEVSDYVLSKFTQNEAKVIEDCIDSLSDYVSEIASRDFSSLKSKFAEKLA